jgi:hypothetical protein
MNYEYPYSCNKPNDNLIFIGDKIVKIVDKKLFYDYWNKGHISVGYNFYGFIVDSDIYEDFISLKELYNNLLPTLNAIKDSFIIKCDEKIIDFYRSIEKLKSPNFISSIDSFLSKHRNIVRKEKIDSMLESI